MEVVKNIFQAIYNLGALVMMPLVFFALGMIFKMGFRKSMRSGLTVGVGFAGIYLVLDYFLRTISDVGTTLAGKFGGALSYTDIGWASFAAFGWASAIGVIFIPIGLVTNLIFLFFGWTKVLSVNIWDYWESIIAGVIIQTMTGNFWFGLIFATLVHLFNLKVGDWTQPLMQNYFGFQGISSYAAGYAEWGIMGRPIAWLVDRIPGISKVKLTPEVLTKRFGFFGEPISIGMVIGLIMGLLAGKDLGASFLLGINLAAVMYIQPKMISIFMEGMVPLSDGAKNFLQKRAPGREIFIGLDPAIGTGNSTALAVAVLMVPVAIVLAFVIPGSKVMPLADLTFIVFFSMWAAALCKGDVLRSFITTVVFTIFAILAGSFTAPIMNVIAQNSGLLPADQASAMVTHFANGYFPHSVIAVTLGKLLAPGAEVGASLNLVMGIVLSALVIVSIVGYLVTRKKPAAKAVVAEVSE
ncbi:MAG TPA: PTS transporter subunit IIC [Anaerolineaceae bacterium]|nr:PTS transporter subunit IIC [Anaerolineaceae bacterium]